MGTRMSTQWARKAQKIRHDRDQHILGVRQRLRVELQNLRFDPAKQQKILNAPVVQLVQMLNTGQTTSYELILVFAYRCSTFGLDNCWITEDNFDEAFRIARECDDVRQRTRMSNRSIDQDSTNTLPELFGIPISLKDTIDIKGMASSIGSTARYDFKQPEDGAIVQVLKKSGMIPFVKSNVPQLAMTFESTNNLWGRATNPWDNTRAVGGSSGGEAALIAGRCSPLGIGSDIGGSVRIPSEFCGVYSFKPSSLRYQQKGHTFYEKSIGGNINIPLTMGPMGRSVEDLALIVKILTDEGNYTKTSMDPYFKITPFNIKMYRSLPPKMRIGYFDNIDIMPATSASKRAINMVKIALQKLGHEFVRVKLPHEEDLIGTFYEYVSAEGDMKGYRQILQGETLIKEYNTVSMVFAMPNCLVNCLSSVQNVLNQIINRFKPRLGFIMSRSTSKDAHEYLKLSYRHQIMKEDFIKMWRHQNLDLLICPGFGSQAVKHGYSEDTTLAACYTYVWNLLQTPVGNMPITRVQPDQEIYHQTFNDSINEKLTDSAKGSAGLPVGIQVVGMPNEDERVLGAMRLIEGLFPFYRENKFPV